MYVCTYVHVYFDVSMHMCELVYVFQNQDKKLTSQETHKQKQIEKVKKILTSAAASITTKQPVTVKRDVASTQNSSVTSVSPTDPAGGKSRSQVASSCTHTPALPGSKRACNEAAVNLTHKRRCVTGAKVGQSKGSRLVSTQDSTSAVENGAKCSSGRTHLEHLLVVAGVQVSGEDIDCMAVLISCAVVSHGLNVPCRHLIQWQDSISVSYRNLRYVTTPLHDWCTKVLTCRNGDVYYFHRL